MPRPADSVVALWTAPRCCGTAFELMVESRGDFRVEVNVFDHVFYFLDRQGNDPPKEDSARNATTFEETHRRLMARAKDGRIFMRNAAYTVMNHLDEATWDQMRHCFVIRDPHYALPSHRRLVPDITRAEAGYEPQLKLFRHFSDHCDRAPIVIDAHELLNHPRQIVAAWCDAVGVPFLEHSLQWESGFRPRWGMWPHWKADAARSTGFSPVTRNEATEQLGAADPLFESSWQCYQQLHEHRLSVSKIPAPSPACGLRP